MEDDKNNQNNSIEHYIIQFIIGFVTFGGNIHVYLINFSTKELIKGLNIFPHKVNIYMSKLFGLRSILTLIGALTYHLITVYYSKNYMTFSIVSLFSVFFTKLVLLIVLYKSLSLSFYFFIILSLEAFVSGFFQNSLFVIAPEYTSTIILSVDISIVCSLGIKLIICYFCKESDLTIIKVELWITLSINIIRIGLLLFFSFYYYKGYSDFYSEGIKKIKEIIQEWSSINSYLKKFEDIYKSLDNMLDTVNEMDELDMGDVIDKKIKTQKNILEELKNKLKEESEGLDLKKNLEKIKEELQNGLELFSMNIKKLKDLCNGPNKSKSNFKKSIIKEFYNEIDIILNNSEKIKEKIGQIKTHYDETERIKVKIDDINENIDSINKIIDRADRDDKKRYSDMSDSIKKDVLMKHTDTIKGNIKNLKNKIDINDILSKIKPEIMKIEENMSSKVETNENHIFINVKKCLNQYLMILVASAFKDFLYPQIIPHSVLEDDKWSLIEKITPSFYFIGSSFIFFIYSHIEDLERIKSYFDFLGALNVIPFVIFIISLMSIHTKISVFRGLMCSQYKILALTSILISSFRIIESYTYVSISDIVEWVPECNHSVSVLTLHHLLTIFYSYLFDNISKGYIDTMLSIGYTVPFVEPNNKRSCTFCYLFKNTFKSTFKNIMFDLKINIREYI